MSGISTHILNTAAGKPLPNVRVRLFQSDHEISSNITDANGRCAALLPPNIELTPGVYRLLFEVGSCFPDAFYREVNVIFQVRDGSSHYHLPLLISPFGYTTYRGS
jgi:5-hydroxyisourate hydrolase